MDIQENTKIVKYMYEIFTQIKDTAGKNDKIQIIKDNSYNVAFKSFLKFLYDDMITTGLSNKKINKKIKTNGAVTVRGFDSPLSVMKYVEGGTGTDKNILAVQTYLDDLDEPYREFMKEILTKSYKCGITATSVNKAIPNQIKQFKVQLAQSYEKFADKVGGDYSITQKLDGHRTLAEIYDNGTVIFRTRKGHQIHGMYELEQDLLKLFSVSNGRALMIDGEITVSDPLIPIDKVFQETSKIIRKDGEKTGLMFHVFDALPLDEFWMGESLATYKERRNSLNRLFEYSSYLPEHIELVKEIYSGHRYDVIPVIMDSATNLGWEGLMINLHSEPYKCTRTKGLLKVKKFHSADLEIVGVFSGEVGTKYSEILGGFIVNLDGKQVGVGSGFSDSQRQEFWDNQDDLIGKIAEISYFEKTTNQNDDSISLRFPVFQMLREDKTVEDVNYE